MNELENAMLYLYTTLLRLKSQVDKPVTPTMQVNKEQEKKVEILQLLICLSIKNQHFQRL